MRSLYQCDYTRLGAWDALQTFTGHNLSCYGEMAADMAAFRIPL